MVDLIVVIYMFNDPVLVVEGVEVLISDTRPTEL